MRSRNGLKYATLCGGCNSKLGQYDGALAELVTITEAHLKGTDGLRTLFRPAVRPGAIVRSLLGHIMSAKLESDEVQLDCWIRDYLNGQPLNENVWIYFWLYPYPVTTVARDFVFHDGWNHGTSDGMSSVIKFFPWAFLVADEDLDLPLPTLNQFASLTPAKVISIAVNLEIYMPAFWPERPNRKHIVLGGRTFFDAVCSIDGHFPKRQSIQPLPE